MEDLQQNLRGFAQRGDEAMYQCLMDAADEIERLRSLTIWQPIETAPKDGTRILVWRALEKGYESHRIGVDFWRVSRGLWWKSRRDMQPTHWMPLPLPPEADT